MGFVDDVINDFAPLLESVETRIQAQLDIIYNLSTSVTVTGYVGDTVPDLTSLINSKDDAVGKQEQKLRDAIEIEEQFTKTAKSCSWFCETHWSQVYKKRTLVRLAKEDLVRLKSQLSGLIKRKTGVETAIQTAKNNLGATYTAGTLYYEKHNLESDKATQVDDARILDNAESSNIAQTDPILQAKRLEEERLRLEAKLKYELKTDVAEDDADKEKVMVYAGVTIALIFIGGIVAYMLQKK